MHTDASSCISCPYDIRGKDCTALMAIDVLDLLKEREEKLVLNIADSIAGMEIGDCPGCGRHLVNKISDPTKFCKYCGQVVKWE